VPLAIGVLLMVWALLEHRPVGMSAQWVAAPPIWLQLALVMLLAFAMPSPVAAWFRGIAAG